MAGSRMSDYLSRRYRKFLVCVAGDADGSPSRRESRSSGCFRSPPSERDAGDIGDDAPVPAARMHSGCFRPDGVVSEPRHSGDLIAMGCMHI